jgi:hypothetical protein
MKVDQHFEEEILSVISPLGVKASLRANEQLAEKDNERCQALMRSGDAAVWHIYAAIMAWVPMIPKLWLGPQP